jgi:hypothetical protein
MKELMRPRPVVAHRLDKVVDAPPGLYLIGGHGRGLSAGSRRYTNPRRMNILVQIVMRLSISLTWNSL